MKKAQRLQGLAGLCWLLAERFARYGRVNFDTVVAEVCQLGKTGEKDLHRHSEWVRLKLGLNVATILHLPHELSCDKHRRNLQGFGQRGVYFKYAISPRSRTSKIFLPAYGDLIAPSETKPVFSKPEFDRGVFRVACPGTTLKI